MYYFNVRHNTKKENSSKNTFHYLTRTGHFANHKDGEELEYVKSGNMPEWAKKSPGEFWGSADKYEIARGRTATVLTIALPKELSKQYRAALVETFIQEFANTHKFPYTAAVHNHESTLTGEDQPHLHLMYSERSLSDDIERPAAQFFKQYRPKNPKTGGAPKITANALGQGKNQINTFRQLTENTINDYLQRYAPTKILTINGLEIQVKNEVTCLSNTDYNQRYGTELQDVPQIPRWKLHSADPIIQLQVQAQKESIRTIREHNNREIHKTAYQQAMAKQQEQQPPISAFAAADDMRLYYDGQKTLHWAERQDQADRNNYLQTLEQKQSYLMEFIRKHQEEKHLNLAYQILKNDQKLLKMAKERGHYLNGHKLEMAEVGTRVNLNSIENRFEALQKAPEPPQKTAENRPTPEQDNEYEPPSPF